MADFLIELLAEILEPIFSWLTENPKISKPLRYCIASLPPIALLAFFACLLAGASVLWEQLIYGVLCLGVLVMWFFLLRKIYRS